MTSMRRQLVVTLLAGILSFYLVLTLVFYFYADRVLQRHFDHSLSTQLETFGQMTEVERDGLELDFHRLRLAEFQASHAEPAYYQVWSGTGEVLARSPSLGSIDLRRPDRVSAEATFHDVPLPGGRSGRAVVRRFVPRVDRGARRSRRVLEAEPIEMMVARSREPLDRAKSVLLRSFFAFFLILPAGTFVIVRWATGRGLGALERISREIAGLRPDNLRYRFPTADLPQELVPVSERLNDLLQRLQTAFERERRITADIAHELRTPLAELRVVAEVELSRKSGVHRSYLEEVLAIAKQMENLVTTLLAISRSEAGLQSADIRPVELGELLEESWRSWRSEAEEKNVSWTLERPGPLWVRSDPDLLSAVLANLLSNAVSYTPRGGAIRCRLRRDADGPVLELGNTARELERGDLEHLFEPLWRKEASRSEGAHHGLGLSLVRAYARLLELSIEADLPQPDWFELRIGFPPSEPAGGGSERRRAAAPRSVLAGSSSS